MVMPREVATYELDRPHKAVVIDQRTLGCVCGRASEHELHSSAARELAADTGAPATVTEKGS